MRGKLPGNKRKDNFFSVETYPTEKGEKVKFNSRGEYNRKGKHKKDEKAERN